MPIWLIALFNYLFKGVRNPQREPDDITDIDRVNMLLDVGRPPSNREPTIEVEVDDDADTPPIEIIEPPLTLSQKAKHLLEQTDWDPPMGKLPATRSMLVQIFGDPGPSKKSREHKKFQRRWLSVAEDLPGTWNNGRPRLYVHKLFEPYLRMALWLTEMLVGLVPIHKLGAYSFRRIRHGKNAPLSDHSWASAVDANSDENRGVYRYRKWQRKANGIWEDCPPDLAKRGPVTLPYDKTWLATWPEGIPFEMAYAFIAVGLTWGATWSFPHSEWVPFVERYGSGYDPDKLPQEEKAKYDRALNEWQRISFCDPMHFEARNRQPS